jgi:hypothetical protein
MTEMARLHAHNAFLPTAVVLIAALALSLVVEAVDKDKVLYVGGTLSGIQEKAEGRLQTTSDEVMSFEAGNKGTVTIPYAAVSSLEYGQKAGRRVAVGILVSPLALFSKKRNHYLTITYSDTAGKEQAGVFELGKDLVRTTLKILEVRTGKEIEFQDVDACRQYKTPKECEATE